MCIRNYWKWRGRSLYSLRQAVLLGITAMLSTGRLTRWKGFFRPNLADHRTSGLRLLSVCGQSKCLRTPSNRSIRTPDTVTWWMDILFILIIGCPVRWPPLYVMWRFPFYVSLGLDLGWSALSIQQTSGSSQSNTIPGFTCYPQVLSDHWIIWCLVLGTTFLQDKWHVVISTSQRWTSTG